MAVEFEVLSFWEETMELVLRRPWLTTIVMVGFAFAITLGAF